MEHQISFQDLLSGRMSQEHSAVTKEKTSKQSSKHSVKSREPMCQYLNLQKDDGILLGASWEMVSALRGEYTTVNFGEFPKDVRESTLLQILQANAPEKYYLSPKACQGILNRAARRGKILPPMLQEALEEVIRLNA